MRASIIVVEFNTGAFLERCLSSLERLEMPREDFEVIVVDNASPTPVDAIEARMARVRFLRSETNLGFAGACAMALGHCRGDIVLTLNPDAEAEPTWLHGMLSPFADPRIGVVGCKVYYPGTRILQHAGGLLLPNGRTEHRGRGEEDVGQYDELEDVAYVTGASIAVRREVIDRVGFFSPVYFPAYFEETELCVRARAAGYRVVYTPEAAIYHREAAASGGSATTAFLRMYHASRVRFVLRNYTARELVGRVVPSEIAFQLEPGRSSMERFLCLRAYVLGALTAQSRS